MSVQNGAAWNLEDGTMDFGPSGATARLDEQSGACVTLRLYDVMGRAVRTLAQGPQEGRTEMQVGVSDLPSGTYFLRLVAEGPTRMQKLTIVR